MMYSIQYQILILNEELIGKKYCTDKIWFHSYHLRLKIQINSGADSAEFNQIWTLGGGQYHYKYTKGILPFRKYQYSIVLQKF